jgi:hypothetical protein
MKPGIVAFRPTASSPLLSFILAASNTPSIAASGCRLAGPNLLTPFQPGCCVVGACEVYERLPSRLCLNVLQNDVFMTN